jgi:hypothetical protein
LRTWTSFSLCCASMNWFWGWIQVSVIFFCTGWMGVICLCTGSLLWVWYGLWWKLCFFLMFCEQWSYIDA